MDVNGVLDLWVDQAHSNLIDFPNTKTIKYLNLIKDDFFAVLITSAWEKWNWDIWETSSVVWQSEYVIPEAASDTEWNLKIDAISISYTWELEDDWSLKYKKARPVEIGNLPQNWNYYRNKQSKEDPIFYIADKSIFIAPAPVTENWAIVDWVQIKWIKSIPDYSVWWTEASIKLPSYLHSVLVTGLAPYIRRSEWNESKGINAQVEYERQRDLAVEKFKNRFTSPLFMNYPDGTGLWLDIDDFITNTPA